MQFDQLKRREFLSLIGSAAGTWPLAARAQQTARPRRLGVLMNFAETDPVTQRFLGPLKRGLASAGWLEGQNLSVDYRWGVTDAERAKNHAAALLQLEPDVILSSGSVSMAALHATNKTTPVVFLLVSDPVAQGFVSNLARPGGLNTGFSTLEFSIGGKWLELIRDFLPSVARVAVMFGPEVNPYATLLVQAMETAGTAFNVATQSAPLRTAIEIEARFGSLHRESLSAFIVLQDAFTVANRKTIIDLANRLRICGIYANPLFVREGGLASYAPDLSNQFGQAASYVDRILRGEKPGDLPIQQPTKYELAINLKTAKALGIEAPPTLLARADEVIE